MPKDEMQVPNLRVVTLDNIAGGRAASAFERNLAEVLTDIDDPNTSPKAARKITIEIVFKPDENRGTASVEVRSRVKLAGLRPVTSTIHIAKKGSRMIAFGTDPAQMQILMDPPTVVKGGADVAAC